MITILFLSTGNPARSQMAAGLTEKLFGDKIESYAASLEPTETNPHTRKVMEEAGVDISRLTVHDPGDFRDIDLDYLVTLCDHSRENCPIYLIEKPAKRLHISLPDPAAFKGSEEETIRFFRKVREELKLELKAFFEGVLAY